MTVELLSFIKALEKEIQQQAWLLNQYINQKDWGKANNQQWYIAGLEKALRLARTSIANSEEAK